MTHEELLERVLALTIAEQDEFILAVHKPRLGEVTLPMLDKTYLKTPSKWDYEKIMLVTGGTYEAVKKAIKKAKITIKRLPELNRAPLLLKPIPREVWVRVFKDGEFFHYPKDKREQVMFHLFLKAVNTIEEDREMLKWYVSEKAQYALKKTAVIANKNFLTPLGILPERPTDELEHCISTGLSKRHLTLGQGHYNMDLIQAEIFWNFGIWYRPDSKELMPKHYIDQS